MSNHVLIVDGVVVQSDRTGKPPKGFVEAADGVVPGYRHANGEFTPPVLPVTERQPSALETFRSEFDALKAALITKAVVTADEIKPG